MSGGTGSRHDRAPVQPWLGEPALGTPASSAAAKQWAAERRGRIVRLPIASLVPTQRRVDPDKVLSMAERSGGLKPIAVMLLGQFHLIIDGHHRACAHVERGDAMVPARVLRAVPG